MKFHRDGYDYISECGNYVISKYYDLWGVWFKDKRVYLADTFKDAKEYCKNHKSGNEEVK